MANGDDPRECHFQNSFYQHSTQITRARLAQQFTPSKLVSLTTCLRTDVWSLYKHIWCQPAETPLRIPEHSPLRQFIDKSKIITGDFQCVSRCLLFHSNTIKLLSYPQSHQDKPKLQHAARTHSAVDGYSIQTRVLSLFAVDNCAATAGLSDNAPCEQRLSSEEPLICGLHRIRVRKAPHPQAQCSDAAHSQLSLVFKSLSVRRNLQWSQILHSLPQPVVCKAAAVSFFEGL